LISGWASIIARKEPSAKTLFGLITYEYEVKNLDIHKIAIKNHIISLTLLTISAKP